MEPRSQCFTTCSFWESRSSWYKSRITPLKSKELVQFYISITESRIWPTLDKLKLNILQQNIVSFKEKRYTKVKNSFCPKLAKNDLGFGKRKYLKMIGCHPKQISPTIQIRCSKINEKPISGFQFEKQDIWQGLLEKMLSKIFQWQKLGVRMLIFFFVSVSNQFYYSVKLAVA